MPITAATAPRELYVLGGTQLIGLPGGLGGAKSAEGDSIWPSPDCLETGYERGGLITAIGQLRLRETSPEKILQQFHEARTGRLMCYYQLFWPIFIKHDEVVERVLKLKEFCDKQPRDKFPRWQRVVTLPAVAAIHALGSSFRSKDTERLYELILNTLPTEELQAHQGVLEILWQNMTAALIRNRHDWEPNTEQKSGWFYMDDRLITRAVALCRASLVPEGRFLLRAALVAWQFLLTYERALLARGDKESAVQVKAVRQEASRVHGRDFVARVVWLKEFEKVYEPLHRYEDMLPQLTELEMGRQHLSRPAVRLATLAHLQAIYDNHLIAQGKFHSDYMDARSAAETAAKSFRFFADFGGSRDDWQPLKQFAKQQRLLSQSALKYLDSLFIGYEKAAEQWESEVDREWLAKWVPFREWDEREVFFRTYHPQSRDELNKLIVTASEEDGLIELWKRVAKFGAEHGARRRNLSVTSHVLSKIEGELLSLAPEYREEREFLQDVLPKSRVSVHSRMDKRGADAPEKEIAMCVDLEKPAEPETIREFEDFNDPPLWGQRPEELEKRFHVQIEVLDDKPDELSGSYGIRVSGSRASVRAFRKEYVSHLPLGLFQVE